MITNMFSVQDMKAGAFLPPFISENKETAMRMIADAMLRDGHPFKLHPEDYTLYWIGAFDLSGGVLTPGGLEPICNLVQLKG